MVFPEYVIVNNHNAGEDSLHTEMPIHRRSECVSEGGVDSPLLANNPSPNPTSPPNPWMP